MITPAASRIAVVDDDDRVLESLRELLEAAGYTVQPYPSSGSLLPSGKLQTLDFLITDIGLPEIDGFELCQRVRSQRPDLPVIFITARHDTLDQQRADAQGLCRLFRKPFYAATLLTEVDRALRNAEPRRN
ncbi:response regulator transcription factor [Mesorhizobium sp. ASY16-5R]|uniref:response regulator transcription factor n=1 Tax=Mesorhizobium sp. ASY16-5R TaxID=3445772 RepID=UPI003FA0BFC0